MATVETLTAQVIDIVKDNAYDEDAVLELLNAGLVDCTSRVLVPDLETSGEVTTSTLNYVLMPDDYQRNLFHVAFAASENLPRKIELCNSPAQLMRMTRGMFGQQGANVVAVAPAGKAMLMYAPIPVTAQTLEVHYYRKPDALVDDEDVPVLPDFCHQALVHFACKALFAIIEDGMEGKKTNTDYHQGRYDDFLIMLEDFFKEGVSRPPATVVRGNFL